MADEKKKGVVMSFEEYLAKEEGSTDTQTTDTPQGDSTAQASTSPDATPAPSAGGTGDAAPAGDDTDLMLLDEPESGDQGQTAAPAATAPAQPVA